MNFNITSLEFVLVHSDVSNIISKLHHRHLIVLVAGCLFYRSGIMWIIYLLVVLLTTTITIQQHAATSVITHNTNARDMLTIFCCFQYFTSCCLKLSFTCMLLRCTLMLCSKSVENTTDDWPITSHHLISSNPMKLRGLAGCVRRLLSFISPNLTQNVGGSTLIRMCPFDADILSIQVMETFAMFHVS